MKIHTQLLINPLQSQSDRQTKASSVEAKKTTPQNSVLWILIECINYVQLLLKYIFMFKDVSSIYICLMLYFPQNIWITYNYQINLPLVPAYLASVFKAYVWLLSHTGINDKEVT